MRLGRNQYGSNNLNNKTMKTINFTQELEYYCKVNNFCPQMVMMLMEENKHDWDKQSWDNFKFFIAGKYNIPVREVKFEMPRFKVYRETKYSGSSRWMKSHIKYFENKEEAQAYMARQNHLLQVFEGLRGEVTHYGALYSSEMGSQVMLILEDNCED